MGPLLSSRLHQRPGANLVDVEIRAMDTKPANTMGPSLLHGPPEETNICAGWDGPTYRSSRSPSGVSTSATQPFPSSRVPVRVGKQYAKLRRASGSVRSDRLFVGHGAPKRTRTESKFAPCLHGSRSPRSPHSIFPPLPPHLTGSYPGRARGPLHAPMLKVDVVCMRARLPVTVRGGGVGVGDDSYPHIGAPLYLHGKGIFL